MNNSLYLVNLSLKDSFREINHIIIIHGNQELSKTTDLNKLMKKD